MKTQLERLREFKAKLSSKEVDLSFIDGVREQICFDCAEVTEHFIVETDDDEFGIARQCSKCGKTSAS